MRLILGLAASFLCLVFYGIACTLYGYGKGKKQGRQAADEWLLGKEPEVDEARQEIWREEG